MSLDFKTAINELVSGKITVLKVDPKDFFAFHQAWESQLQRKEIIGTAQRNGTVIYRFHENGKQ